jgi:hypothetical protein
VDIKVRLGAVVKGSATTAANGGYTISGLPPRAVTHTVTASRNFYVTFTKTGIPVVPGRTTIVNFFQFQKSGIITGGVKDDATGNPIGGAQVKAYLNGTVLKASATTAADGTYTISRDLPAGTYSVSAGRIGYVTLTKTDIPVVAGQTTIVNFYHLVKSGMITGGVKEDGTGNPIGGAQVRAYLNGTVLKASATTAADGTYTISRDLPAGTYGVSAGRSGYITYTKTGVVVPQGVTTIVNFYHLVKSGIITGGVKDDGTGLPIAGAEVKAYLNGTTLKATAVTGADGAYAIRRDLPAGTYSVSVSKPGYVTLTKTAIPVVAGKSTTVNFYHLQPQ